MNQTEIAQLFSQHYGRLTRLARTLLYDEEEARDVVSEVFATLIDRNAATEGLSHVEAYLTMSVRNRCLNLLRNRSIQQRIQRLYLLEQEVEAKSAEQLCEESRLLEQGIGQLEPPVCEQVVRFHFEQGMTFREIALQLGTSETTIYKYLRRAMKQLRQHLNNEL